MFRRPLAQLQQTSAWPTYGVKVGMQVGMHVARPACHVGVDYPKSAGRAVWKTRPDAQDLGFLPLGSVPGVAGSLRLLRPAVGVFTELALLLEGA